jgi:hypothetical protein
MISRFLCNIDNQEHAGRWLRKQPKRECEAPYGFEWNQFRHVFPHLGCMDDEYSAPGGIENARSRNLLDLGGSPEFAERTWPAASHHTFSCVNAHSLSQSGIDD